MSAHKHTLAREDYLVIIWEAKGGEPYPELFLSASTETVQAQVSKLKPPLFEAYEVRRITDGYPARDVTDEFEPPFDEDEPSPAHSAKIARAEREYRMKKEAF
jgi:hypothetical protein